MAALNEDGLNRCHDKAAPSNPTSIRPAVLRIKRKRNEDPYEVLLIHHTESKKSKEESTVRDDGYFKLACSVKASDEGVKLNVDEVLHNHLGSIRQQPVKGRPSQLKAHRISEIRNAIRHERQEEHVKERFRLVANQRSVSQPKMYDDEQSQIKIFDVIKSDFDCTSQSTSTVCDENESRDHRDEVKIMLDTLTISADKDDLVFDYYIANQPVFLAEDVKFDVEAIAEDYWLDILHYQQHHDGMNNDDEDDSNDENNWRNDYPDEHSSSDSSSEESTSSSTDDLYRCDDSRRSRQKHFKNSEFDGGIYDEDCDVYQENQNYNYYAEDFYGDSD